MIDLHTHTNESDGSYTPVELIDHAVALKLEALAISDHDTFAGYDRAVQPAADAGLDLVCAIELGRAPLALPGALSTCWATSYTGLHPCNSVRC